MLGDLSKENCMLVISRKECCMQSSAILWVSLDPFLGAKAKLKKESGNYSATF